MGKHEKPGDGAPNTASARVVAAVLTAVATSAPAVADRHAAAESNARLN